MKVEERCLREVGKYIKRKRLNGSCNKIEMWLRLDWKEIKRWLKGNWKWLKVDCKMF